MQTCGLDYRTAYQVVGVAVRTAHQAGLRGIDLDGAMLDAAAAEYTGRPLGLTGRRPDRGARPPPDRRAPAQQPAVPRHPRSSRAWRARASSAARSSAYDRRGAPLRHRCRRTDSRGDGVGRRHGFRRRKGSPMTDKVIELPEQVGVVNVGLPLFAAAVAAQGRPVTQVDWRIPAGGEPEVVAALRRLFGPRDRAGGRRQRRGAAAGWTPVPRSVRGISPAAEVVPALAGRTLLHPGPRARGGRRVRPVAPLDARGRGRRGMGRRRRRRRCLLASGEVTLMPANEAGVVVPMATVIGPDHTGLGRRLARGRPDRVRAARAGCGRRRVVRTRQRGRCERLVFLRDAVAPVLSAALRESDPVDVLSLRQRRRSRWATTSMCARRPRPTCCSSTCSPGWWQVTIPAGWRWPGSCRRTTCSSSRWRWPPRGR